MKIFYFVIIQVALVFSVFAQKNAYIPPENFFQNEDAVVETYTNSSAAATIQISTLENIDINSFYETFNKEQFIENGLEIISEEGLVEMDGRVHYFYYNCKYVVQQEHEGQITEFMRIVYFSESNGTLIMAVASFPLISAELLQTPIIESFHKMTGEK